MSSEVKSSFGAVWEALVQGQVLDIYWDKS